MPPFIPAVPVPPPVPPVPSANIPTSPPLSGPVDATLKQAQQLLAAEKAHRDIASTYKHAKIAANGPLERTHWLAAADATSKLIELVALNPERAEELDPGPIKAAARQNTYLLYADQAAPPQPGEASEDKSTISNIFWIGLAALLGWKIFKGKGG